MRPQIQTQYSAGADLTYSGPTLVLHPGQSAALSTGYKYDLEIPSMIKGRSSLAFNANIIAFEGLIDADFKDEVKVKLFNLGVMPYEIYDGDRIAQIVPFETTAVPYFLTKNVIRTGGFGSTSLVESVNKIPGSKL